MNTILTTLSLPKTALSYSYAEIDGERYYSLNLESEEPGTKYFLHNHRIDRIVVIGTKESIDTLQDDSLKVIDNLWNYYEEKLVNNPLYLNGRNWIDNNTNKKVCSYEVFLRRICCFLKDKDTLLDKDETMFMFDKDVPFKEVPFLDEYKKTNRVLTHDKNNNPKNKIQVILVDSEKDGQINYSGLIEALRGNNDINHIYMDMQGGNRTAGFVRNTVLQLLSKQDTYKAKIEQVIATEWKNTNTSFTDEEFSNRIVDVTSDYKVSDLFSGISSFLNYGKADDIHQYLNQGENVSKVNSLCNAMVAVDNALSVNNINALEEALKEVDKCLDEVEKGNDPLFKILAEGIRTDYKPLFQKTDGQIDISANLPAVLDWCISKKQLLTAATLTEARLPKYIITHGIIYPENQTITVNGNECSLLNEYMYFYDEQQLSQHWQFLDPYHFFLKDYLPHYLGANRGIKGVLNRKYGVSIQSRNPSVANIVLAMYSVVSTIRNQLNHATDITPDNIKKVNDSIYSLNFILKKEQKKEYRQFDISGNERFNDFCIEILENVIKDVSVILKGYKSSKDISLIFSKKGKNLKLSFLALVDKELSELNAVLNEYNNNRYLDNVNKENTKKGKNRYYRALVLTPYLCALETMIKHPQTLEGHQERMNFVADSKNEKFLEMMISYYNDTVTGDSLCEPLILKGQRNSTRFDKTFFLKDALWDNEINGLLSRCDEDERDAVVAKILNKIDEVMKSKKSEVDKKNAEERDNQIDALFDFCMDKDFKAMVLWYAQNHTDDMLKVIKEYK